MSKEVELLSFKAKKACKALLKHVQLIEKKREKERKQDILSLDKQDLRSSIPIWVILSTKTFITDTKKLKPSKIVLKHPIINQDSECCMIVKDPQRIYKDLVISAKLNKRVTKVIGISKLRKKYRSYQQRRELRDSYDFFVADSRVISLLPKLLGKAFYEKKRQPIPIDLVTKSTPEHLFKEIEKAYSSTYLHLSPGTCTSIKCGAICQTPEQIVENIQIITNTLAEKFVKNGWKGIRGFHIKTSESIALPIWLCENVFDADVDKVKEIEEIVINNKKRKVDNSDGEDSELEENIDNVQSTQNIHTKKHRKTATKL
ncbi:hypothetical protein T552_00331 [Pneumocystis carinii B80]|uniref:Ribosomal protein L1 n=1 Tax=Pneumocystis carinii (strain B80) TaxID=1408658 RepID=A0A0W4ZQG5_PNEC8|nr:hypothetical protein T552_00331 [Pneumocystis carinii B80]KTW30615.1 hypothetical protein T552_00331 [Pneumocystis carinii B80]